MGQKLFSVDTASRTYFLTGSLDGGVGDDTLTLNFSNNYFYHAWGGNSWSESESPSWYVNLTGLDVTNIETLTVINEGRDYATPSGFVLTTGQLASLNKAAGLTAVTIKGGGIVDLAQLAALNITNWKIGDDLAYTFTGTSASDTVEVGTGQTVVNAGDGNDTIRISDQSNSSNILNGGAGQDTLVISGADVDISTISIDGVEAIRVSSDSLAFSASQWETFGENITRAPGASTKYTLALDTAAVETLADDSCLCRL